MEVEAGTSYDDRDGIAVEDLLAAVACFVVEVDHVEGVAHIPDIEQVVITGSNGRRVGFVVDNVIGEYQTVIKSLGGLYRNQENISGASILGDGTVALILDVDRISDSAQQKGLY